jgi:hypothetical protein
MNVSQPGVTTQTIKNTRTGSVVLLITDTSKAITFASAMPSTNYSVHFECSISTASALGATSKTTTGFTLLSTGVAMTVKYKAIED